MRYYDLDINGKVRGHYAVPQPGPALVLLVDAPDDESKWDGATWVPDQEKIDARQAEADRIAAKVQAKDKIAALGEDADKATTIAGLKVVVKELIAQVKILTE